MLFASCFGGTVSAAQLSNSAHKDIAHHYIKALHGYTWENVTTVVRTQQLAKYFVITVNTGSHTEDLFVSLPAEGGFRVQSLHEAQKEKGLSVPAQSHAGLYEGTLTVIDYKISGGAVMMKGSDGTVVTYKQHTDNTFDLQVADANGKEIVCIGSNQIAYAYKDGAVVRVRVEMPLNEQEAIQKGSGDHGTVNAVGTSNSLTNVDSGGEEYSYVNNPLYHSNRGYTLWFNMSYYGDDDIGDTDPNQYIVTFDSEEGVNLDFYLWVGTPKENMQKYTRLTGTSGMSPTWTFGYWMGAGGGGWANAYPVPGRSNDQTTNVKMVIDGFESQYHIQPKAIFLEGSAANETTTAYSVQHGIKPLMWWRGEGTKSEIRNMVKNSVPQHHVLNADGTIKTYGYPLAINTYLWKNFGIQQFVLDDDNNMSFNSVFDWSNPNSILAGKTGGQGQVESLDKFLGQYKIQGSMLDFGELGLDYGTYANGLTHWEMHNLMAVYYAKGAAQIFNDYWNGDFVTFQRNGWAGSQYYSGNFTGDNPYGFEGVKVQLEKVINLGAGGFNLYGGDIGGYGSKRTTGQAWNRWVSFSCFQPYMRQHGAALTVIWEDVGKLGKKIFDEIYYFRDNITPTIQDAAMDANQTANPIVESMLVAYPKQLWLKDVSDQYLFCDDFLVTVVTEENQWTKEVKFPAGHTWYNIYTYKAFEGGKAAVDDAPISFNPVYLRDGAVKAVNLPAGMKLGDRITDASGDSPAIASLLITPPKTKREVTIHVQDSEPTDYRTYASHTETYTTTPKHDSTFIVTNEEGSDRRIVLALGVTAYEVYVDNQKLSYLAQTPNYASGQIGYTIDPYGLTTMLLPSGWKELKVVEGTMDYKPIEGVTTASSSGASSDQKMTDGNIATASTSVNKTSIKLPASTGIARVRIKWSVGYYDAYTLQYSTNGYTWSNLTTVTDGCGSFDDLSFSMKTARYLRINGTTTGDFGTPSICDIEVYKPFDINTMLTRKAEDADSAAAHTPSEYLSNNDATCTADGTKTRYCLECGEELDTVTDEGSQLAHTFEIYVPNNDATCIKLPTETATCTCGATDTRNVEGGVYSEHQWDSDAYDSTCTVCGEIKNNIRFAEEDDGIYVSVSLRDGAEIKGAIWLTDGTARYPVVRVGFQGGSTASDKYKVVLPEGVEVNLADCSLEYNAPYVPTFENPNIAPAGTSYNELYNGLRFVNRISRKTIDGKSCIVFGEDTYEIVEFGAVFTSAPGLEVNLGHKLDLAADAQAIKDIMVVNPTAPWTRSARFSIIYDDCDAYMDVAVSFTGITDDAIDYFVRMYVIVEDANGEEHVLYGDVAHDNFGTHKPKA